jgi:sporulation protein YqfC
MTPRGYLRLSPHRLYVNKYVLGRGLILSKKINIRSLTSSMNMPTHMEINGNTEVIVEGCSGVLEYGMDAVRIKTGRLIVRFTGRGLIIKCLTADSLVVTGFITGIEFM